MLYASVNLYDYPPLLFDGGVGWSVRMRARMTDGRICFAFASHVDPVWGLDYNRICTPYPLISNRDANFDFYPSCDEQAQYKF